MYRSFSIVLGSFEELWAKSFVANFHRVDMADLRQCDVAGYCSYNVVVAILLLLIHAVLIKLNAAILVLMKLVTWRVLMITLLIISLVMSILLFCVVAFEMQLIV